MGACVFANTQLSSHQEEQYHLKSVQTHSPIKFSAGIVSTL